MSLLFIGGVNGVGKTSIIEKTASVSPSVLAIDGARQLMKQLDINNDDYNKLRSIPEESIEKALVNLFRLLSQEKGRNI